MLYYEALIWFLGFTKIGFHDWLFQKCIILYLLHIIAVPLFPAGLKCPELRFPKAS